MSPETSNWILKAKRNRRLVMLAILIATAVVLFAGRMLLRSSKTVAADSIGASSSSARMAQLDRNAPSIAVTWPVEIKRDLFAWEAILPANSPKAVSESQRIRREAEEKIHLQAILYGEDASRAIVNGAVLQQGQVIDGFSIQRIERGRIVVAKDGVEVEVNL